MKKFLFLLITGVLSLTTLSASTKGDYTEIIYIIDDSGSMKGTEDDVVKGFNAMLKEQRDKYDELILSTILFSDGPYPLHKGVDIRDVKDITRDDYVTGGYTLFRDVLGATIGGLGQQELSLKKKKKRSIRRILFVIMSDGVDNVSSVYSRSDIQKLIQVCQSEFGWEFLFLGTNNISAKGVAASIGIPENRAVMYTADAQGVKIMNECVSSVISSVRQDEEIAIDWSERIEYDNSCRADRLDLVADTTFGFDYGTTKKRLRENDNGTFPTFRGGDISDYKKWVYSRIKYPEEAMMNRLEGRVMINFIVERDGSVGRINVFGTPHECLIQEVVRVLNSSPKWKPGVRDGKACSTKMAVPFIFRIGK